MENESFISVFVAWVLTMIFGFALWGLLFAFLALLIAVFN